MREHEALREQLYGVNSHAHILHALEDLDPQVAGTLVGKSPHTIFQILQHIVYWQDITIARLAGEDPDSPTSSALGWTAVAKPEDASDLEAAIACLAEGLRAIELHLANSESDLGRVIPGARPATAREEILTIQGHNSYHLGQIVSLRTALGAWPPPKGGTRW